MAAKKIEKTNAARLLDRAKIPYTLIPYEVDEEDLSCTHVAAQLGEAIECVFKTLVLKGDRSGYFVCVVRVLSLGVMSCVKFTDNSSVNSSSKYLDG